ncbi:MAG: SpoIIE family protein phosphatase [Planctomycetaceae bacterium]|nr:SpoIIE family protein phosphatase [Planctomycetaceae bacterium]
MAFLRVIQGSRIGELHELISDRLVLGRHPSCEVVLENAVISRQHARMIRQGDSYVIEDLGSRNGTFVNEKKVRGLQLIQAKDHIRICEIVLEYLEELPQFDATVSEIPVDEKLLACEDSNSGELESSSIISTLNAVRGSARLGVRPEAKLRAIIELSTLFSRTVALDAVLKQTIECLFRIFPQIELGSVLLLDPESGSPMVKAARDRSGEETTDVPISMTVVERAIQGHEAILCEDIADDSRFRDSESISALQIRSMMCAPLSGFEEEAFGAIQLTTKSLKQPFSQDDLDLLVSVTAQAGLAIENAKLHAEVIHSHEIERDLEVATQIQLGFLPNKKPDFPDYEFFHYYQAAQQVGGDYFDYVKLPDGRLAIIVADVSGKGVPAALLMARLSSAVRYQLVSHTDVGAAITELNQELLDSSLGFRFITLVVAVLAPNTNKVTIVNAGHLPPLLHDQQGNHFIEGDYSGLPLGIGRELEYSEYVCELSDGATLLFYTDGVTETGDPQGDLFGRSHLLTARPEEECSAEALVQQVLKDMKEFSKGAPSRDDCCIVAIRRLSNDS